ncbi:uncharacterized protein LOC127003348 [Eriocheir sinensis]|uniref:uncharacterized protein LOC127003348 n=1 Tax=Eriocheir sinensis TaxID=95602 RepID=UPI0021C73E0B|nr:uncharacterized protein LOC127003348 [Eriocheir sinensis]
MVGTRTDLAEVEAAAGPNVTTSEVLVLLLPRFLTLTTALLENSVGNTTALSKEVLDMASKFLRLDLDSITSFSLNSAFLELSGGLWSLYLLSIPIFVGIIIWYFIITFVLGKNVIGRNFTSMASLDKESIKDDLTARVAMVTERPNYV